jgi:hypothetical protein
MFNFFEKLIIEHLKVDAIDSRIYLPDVFYEIPDGRYIIYEMGLYRSGPNMILGSKFPTNTIAQAWAILCEQKQIRYLGNQLRSNNQFPMRLPDKGWLRSTIHWLYDYGFTIVIMDGYTWIEHRDRGYGLLKSRTILDEQINRNEALGALWRDFDEFMF